MPPHPSPPPSKDLDYLVKISLCSFVLYGVQDAKASSCSQWTLLSDYAGVQVDHNLHWRSMSFCLFCCALVRAASSEFGTYRQCEQRRFRRACASAQSRQNLRCLLIQAVSQEEHSDRKPDPWPLWMAGHAQLQFVMTECSKTQICLTRLVYFLVKFVSRL